jgi:uncharacterized protein with NRDE domain
MCTVTYLPLKNGFLLTSNRDERTVRKLALKPEVQEINGVVLLFPKDQHAGGTWIATAPNNRTVCLLNGAFEPHIPSPPYRKSRGLVVLDFFSYNTTDEFATTYILQDIEPFTMLIAEQEKLLELHWNGIQCNFTVLNPLTPHIRSSSTLYTPQIKKLREDWFAEWLNKHVSYTIEDVLSFHLFGGEGEDAANKVRMKREGFVQTVSITCVQNENGKSKMHYADLVNCTENSFQTFSFNLPEEAVWPVE